MPAAHVPQDTLRPHASMMLPHVAPAAAQAWAGVPHVRVVALHTWVLVHCPQFWVPPHPSCSRPQNTPRDAQDSSVQPHWLAMPPPPQLSGKVQSPQYSVW